MCVLSSFSYKHIEDDYFVIYMLQIKWAGWNGGIKGVEKSEKTNFQLKFKWFIDKIHEVLTAQYF